MTAAAESTRSHATWRGAGRPFALWPAAELTRYPRPPATLAGQAVALEFDLPPSPPARPMRITLALVLDAPTLARATGLAAFGLTAPMHPSQTPPAPLHRLVLQADLTKTGLARFSGLDLHDDGDLREAFASVLGEAPGNEFHALENWRAIGLEPWRDR